MRPRGLEKFFIDLKTAAIDAQLSSIEVEKVLVGMGWKIDDIVANLKLRRFIRRQRENQRLGISTGRLKPLRSEKIYFLLSELQKLKEGDTKNEFVKDRINKFREELRKELRKHANK